MYANTNMSQQFWPVNPHKSRFMKDIFINNRILRDIPYTQMPELIGSILSGTSVNLLFLNLAFDISYRGIIASICCSSVQQSIPSAIPYDNGEVDTLISYLHAYEYLVRKQSWSNHLLISAHTDGWFTFDSEATSHGTLPSFAFESTC